MFELIAHRRNTIKELCATPVRYGVEVDIRSQGDRLIIHHDPFAGGEDFLDWIDNYRHGTLILNVKEEGLENRVLEAMHNYSISKFFFLDQSFPFLVKWASRGERRCAARVSEFESVDNALSLAGKIDWVWVDCFSRFPLGGPQAARLKAGGFSLCVVSPELQGRDAEKEIPILADLLVRQAICPDAVCTKRPDLWEAAECKFAKS